MSKLRYKKLKLSFYFFIAVLLFSLDGTAGIAETEDSAMKCDACKIISQKFANSYKAAEAEAGGRRLNEDEYIEAAEGTCDEDWTGYGVRVVDGVQRLAGEGSDIDPDKTMDVDSIWERRLQDMCDDLLAEAPDEKTLYHLWTSGNVEALYNYLCMGEGLFRACVPGEDFGAWPGDDYEDYDDVDYGFPHDEF